MEFRLKSIELQTDAEDMVLKGYINVTERESEVMYNKKRNRWFKEIMSTGVFKRSLNQHPSIPLLLEHDFNQELAHTDKGTLVVEEDQIGLKFTAKIENRDLYERVKDGRINNCSFGFRVLDEKYEPINSKLERRRVSEIELIECSLVSNPAYLGSIVETRELEDALKEEEEYMKNLEETKVEETLDKNIETTQETNEEVIEEVTKDVTEEPTEDVTEEVTEETKECIEKIEKNENNAHKKDEVGEPKYEDEETTESDANQHEIEVEENSTENRMVVEEEVDHNIEVEDKLNDECCNDVDGDPSIEVTVVANEEPKVLVDESVAQEITNVIEENIEQKEEELAIAENIDKSLKEHIDYVKQENKMHEDYLEGESARISTDIIRLRLELLKLKSLKKEL